MQVISLHDPRQYMSKVCTKRDYHPMTSKKTKYAVKHLTLRWIKKINLLSRLLIYTIGFRQGPSPPLPCCLTNTSKESYKGFRVITITQDFKYTETQVLNLDKMANPPKPTTLVGSLQTYSVHQIVE